MRWQSGGGSSRWVRGTALVSLALLAGFGSARGQEPETLAGQVVDASGAGVAHARLWAMHPRPGPHRTVEEAAATIGSIPEAQRPQAQARLGVILLDLGRRDQGKKLVEAAVAALPPPAPQAKPGARVPLSDPSLTTVRALARYDVERAQKLAEPILASYHGLLIPSLLAQSFARTDVGLASKLLKQEKNVPNRDVDWALADWRKAEQKIDAALAEVERSPGNTSMISIYALVGLTEVLAASPARRDEMLWSRQGETWHPGRRTVGE